MGSEAVPKRVRMNLFLDASSSCSVLTGIPSHLGVDRPIAGVPTIAWKQPNTGLAPQAAPVLPQRFEQFRAEHDVPIFAALTALNVDHHALAIDVGNLQMCQLGAADAGRIERHQRDTIKRSARRVDQLRYFLRAEDGGQTQHLLGIRRLFGAPRPLERLDEENRSAPSRWVTLLAASFRSRNK